MDDGAFRSRMTFLSTEAFGHYRTFVPAVGSLTPIPRQQEIDRVRRKLPPSFYNLTTLAGAVIAGVSFGLIIFLLLLEQFSETSKPYMGIIAFVILPAFLIGGLAVAAFGVWREHRRQRIGTSGEHHLPVVDLNNPRHQTAVGLV